MTSFNQGLGAEEVIIDGYDQVVSSQKIEVEKKWSQKAAEMDKQVSIELAAGKTKVIGL